MRLASAAVVSLAMRAASTDGASSAEYGAQPAAGESTCTPTPASSIICTRV